MSNQERLEVSARTVHGLRTQAQHLEDEVRLCAQALKDARFELQQESEMRARKEKEVSALKSEGDELANNSEVLRMEEERLRLQSGQVREELAKGKREGELIRGQAETLKDKIMKT